MKLMAIIAIPQQIQGAIALGDQLYVLVQGSDDEGWARNMLYTISLTDGTVTASSQQFINQMTTLQGRQAAGVRAG